MPNGGSRETRSTPSSSARCATKHCSSKTSSLTGTSVQERMSALTNRYFLSILESVPDSVDEVVVDADFEWTTEDGKYSSKAPTAAAAPTAQEELPAEPPVVLNNALPSPSETPRHSSASPKVTGKRKAIEILSSDDEDEQPLSHPAAAAPPPLAPPTRPPALRTPSASASVPRGTSEVIDLTLDDSDEEEATQSSSPQFFRQPGAEQPARSAPLPNSFSRQLPSLPTGDNGARLNSYGNPAQSYSASSRSTDPHKLPDIDTSILNPNWARYSNTDPYTYRFAADSWTADDYRNDRNGSTADRGYLEPSSTRYDRYSPTKPAERSHGSPQKRYRASEWMRDDLAKDYNSGNPRA